MKMQKQNHQQQAIKETGEGKPNRTPPKNNEEDDEEHKEEENKKERQTFKNKNTHPPNQTNKSKIKKGTKSDTKRNDNERTW